MRSRSATDGLSVSLLVLASFVPNFISISPKTHQNQLLSPPHITNPSSLRSLFGPVFLCPQLLPSRLRMAIRRELSRLLTHPDCRFIQIADSPMPTRLAFERAICLNERLGFIDALIPLDFNTLLIDCVCIFDKCEVRISEQYRQDVDGRLDFDGGRSTMWEFDGGQNGAMTIENGFYGSAVNTSHRTVKGWGLGRSSLSVERAMSLHHSDIPQACLVVILSTTIKGSTHVLSCFFCLLPDSLPTQDYAPSRLFFQVNRFITPFLYPEASCFSPASRLLFGK